MFEVAQILLRQQVQRIIAVWDLPPELEVGCFLFANKFMYAQSRCLLLQVVARDLWALYISATDLTPEPLIAQQEEQDFQNKASNKTSQSERSRVNTSPQPNDFDQPLSSSNSSSQEDGSDHSDHDDEFSHHDEEHLEDDLEGPKRTYTGPTRSRGNKGRQSHDPARVFHAHFTLAICYLSCLLLRVPVFMQQILQSAFFTISAGLHAYIPFLGLQSWGRSLSSASPIHCQRNFERSCPRQSKMSSCRQ